MNLFEITDEFANPKTTPQEDLKFLEKREKNIKYQLELVRGQLDAIRSKVAGTLEQANWSMTNPEIPDQKEAIDKKIAAGFIPVWKPAGFGTATDKKYVECFIPNVPHNVIIAKQLEKLIARAHQLEEFRREIPSRVKRAKGRLSAWNRKQPHYVGRATGKELLKQLVDKVTEFLTGKGWDEYRINNSYYWAKNKTIVMEIPVRAGMEGKRPIDTAKTIIKPAVDKFIESLGYTHFRVTDRWYQDSRMTVVKIEVDDVEARDKAAEKAADATKAAADDASFPKF